MNTANGDRNLLFGILALQMDFITRDALVQAMHAWVLDKAKPLSQILVEQGALNAARRAMLEPLVQEHIQQHGGDAEKSLAAVSSVGSARDLLKQIADPDVQASLVNLPAADPNATKYPSAGDASAVGRRFMILRPHAEGGLGKVSVALDGELNREVALKEIQEQYADHSQSRARFLLEAEITGGLEHPSIVPVYGLGQYEDGRPFYAMRFIKGDSLKEAVERFHKTKGPINSGKRALELRQLLGRFNDVCDAIAYAHSRGVLHRDLKPGNVMLGKYGETLVVDWGLAKPVGGAANKDGDAEVPLRPMSSDDSAPTQMGSAIGTPQFMPPEQAAGRLDQMGPASDVYSLGATLYCLLTGKPPFTDRDVGVVLQKVQRGDFPPPRQVRREIPPALEAICLKAMALRPADRYPTARALAGDIEKWLADEPVSAWRDPWRMRVGRWTRRHQKLTGATVAGLLVAILANNSLNFIMERQTVEKREAVESALGEVSLWQAQARWGEAQAVLDQAKHRFGNRGPGDLKSKLDKMQTELTLAERLDDARSKRAVTIDGRIDSTNADRQYEDAFRRAGMGDVEGNAATAAAWVRHSGVREIVVTALDDWACCIELRKRRSWVLEVTRRADPDPWRDRARDPETLENAAALTELTKEAAAKNSPQLLAVLGLRLADLKGDAEGLLREVQGQYPNDFYSNMCLGAVLMHNKKSEEAVGYLRAALAVRPRTPIIYNNLGNALIVCRKPEQAEVECRKAIQLDYNFAPAHSNLGQALSDQGKQEEAAAEYQKAIELEPKNSAFHMYLAADFAKNKSLEKAEAEYRRAIEFDPKSGQAHNNLGFVLRDLGKREEAAAEYHKAIELVPKVAEPHYNLGQVQGELGKWQEAVAEYRKGIAIGPDSAMPHYNLGLILENHNKGDEAAAEYRAAIELAPKVSGFHYRLGLILTSQGKRQEAGVEYRKVIELDPKYAMAYNGLGNSLLAEGKWEQAAAEHRKAIEIDPKAALPHYLLGGALFLQGKGKEASTEYRKAIELDAKYAAAHFGLGLILSAEGKPAEAEAEYRKAIELDPKIALAHCKLGDVLRRLGKPEEAASEYHKDIALDPKNALSHNGLGLLSYDQAKWELATTEFRAAIQLNPKEATFYFSLGMALEQQGQFVEAKLVCQQCLELLSANDKRRKALSEQLQRCEQMIALDKKLPAIIKGEAKPADAAELKGFAQLIWLKKHYSDAARFYADAFAAQPALANDLQADTRYIAATVAVLAAAGHGVDKPDDKESARLRRQALDWLRADLTAWSMYAEIGTPKATATVQTNLKQWQQASGLASVRDAAVLDKLPEAERAEWKKLWADVAELLKKSGESGKK
jgi:tetratricopeptide (TPR) repeat protein/serine/threonine protein kinase